MYNRYDGNTGRFVRVPDPEPPKRSPMTVPGRPSGLPAAAHPQQQQRRGQPNNAHTNNAHSKPGRPNAPQKRPPPGGGGGLGNLLSFGGLSEKLQGILPKFSLDELETEDFIMMLMLYLMYRESGDKELLIILGSMFLF